MFQDGTIGDDIVVKPLSAQVRQVLSTRRMSAEDNTENGGEDDSGILEGYVRSLRDMDEHRPRHARFAYFLLSGELSQVCRFLGSCTADSKAS